MRSTQSVRRRRLVALMSPVCVMHVACHRRRLSLVVRGQVKSGQQLATPTPAPMPLTNCTFVCLLQYFSYFPSLVLFSYYCCCTGRDGSLYIVCQYWLGVFWTFVLPSLSWFCDAGKRGWTSAAGRPASKATGSCSLTPTPLLPPSHHQPRHGSARGRKRWKRSRTRFFML